MLAGCMNCVGIMLQERNMPRARMTPELKKRIGERYRLLEPMCVARFRDQALTYAVLVDPYNPDNLQKVEYDIPKGAVIKIIGVYQTAGEFGYWEDTFLARWDGAPGKYGGSEFSLSSIQAVNGGELGNSSELRRVD